MKTKQFSKKRPSLILGFVVIMAFSMFLSIITIQPNVAQAALVGAEPGFLFEDFENIEVGTLPLHTPATEGADLPVDSERHFAFPVASTVPRSENTVVCANPAGEGNVVRLEGKYGAADDKQYFYSKTMPVEGKGQVTNYTISLDVYLPTNMKGLSEYLMVQLTPGSNNSKAVARPFKIAGGETGKVGETGKTYIMPYAGPNAAGSGFDAVEVPVGKWFKVVYELDANTKYGKSDLYVSYWEEDEYVTKHVYTLTAGNQAAQTPESWNTGILKVNVFPYFAATATGETMTQIYLDNLYVNQNAKNVAFGPAVFDAKIQGKAIKGQEISVDYKYQSQYLDASTFQWYKAVDTGDTATLDFVAIDGATAATYTIAQADEGCLLKCIISPKDSANRTAPAVETEVFEVSITFEENLVNEPGYVFEDFENIEVGALPLHKPETEGTNLPEDSGKHVVFPVASSVTRSENTVVCANPAGEGNVVRLEGKYGAQDDKQYFYTKLMPASSSAKSGKYTVSMDVYLPTSMKGLSEYLMWQLTAGSNKTPCRPFKIAGGETGKVGETGKTYIMPYAGLNAVGAGFNAVEVPVGTWFKVVYELDCNVKYGASSLYISYMNEGEYVTTEVFALTAGNQPAQTPEVWNTGLLKMTVNPLFAATAEGETMTQIYVDNVYMYYGNEFAPEVCNVNIEGDPYNGQTLTGSYAYIGKYANTSLTQWYRAQAQEGVDASELKYKAITGATGTTYTVKPEDEGYYIFFAVIPEDSKGNTSAPTKSAAVLVTGACNIVYDANGEDVSGMPDVTGVVKYRGQKVDAPATEPTRTGYTFGGWYKETTCENAWDFENDTLSGDLTLYAKWNIVSYAITFDANGKELATGMPTETNVEYQGTILKPNDPELVGHLFGGWYKEATCENAWNFTEDTVTGPVTLYAKWVAKTYTVTFISTMTDDELTPESVKHGEKVTAPTLSDVENYEFDGWYTEAEFTTKWNFDNEVTSSMELYAKFVEKNTTVDSGSGNENSNSGEGNVSGCGSVVETSAFCLTAAVLFASLAIILVKRKENN